MSIRMLLSSAHSLSNSVLSNIVAYQWWNLVNISDNGTNCKGKQVYAFHRRNTKWIESAAADSISCSTKHHTILYQHIHIYDDNLFPPSVTYFTGTLMYWPLEWSKERLHWTNFQSGKVSVFSEIIALEILAFYTDKISEEIKYVNILQAKQLLCVCRYIDG